MDSLLEIWRDSDGVIRTVALVLLAMSLLSWVLMVWKWRVLRQAKASLRLGIPAFWRSTDRVQAESRLSAGDARAVLWPLVQAAWSDDAPGTMAAQADHRSQLTRRLRDALQEVLERLQWGQVWLATTGSVAPFVGLFGTVWGIYRAMGVIAASGSASLDKVAGPVGETLIMTAAGLAVAIPAVLAYNLFGKWVQQCELTLEGFANDLRDLRSPASSGADGSTTP